jgi:hypothetical protein
MNYEVISNKMFIININAIGIHPLIVFTLCGSQVPTLYCILWIVVPEDGQIIMAETCRRLYK